MPESKTTFTITYGGWYQRTTLHLSEIYDLFALGHSELPLSSERLTQHHHILDFASVTREVGNFEYVRALTNSGIEVRYYEDGLYVLTIESADIDGAGAILTEYFERHLHPAVSYIFSLGAPTPKVLADIKTQHPIVVTATVRRPELVFRHHDFGPVYSQIKSGSISVYKSPQYIVILAPPKFGHLRELVEMQIFFREFKDQLHRYLNIHRQIWEEISTIKERGSIAGREVEPLRADLDTYQKTINLIKSRLGQMNSYIRTRGTIAKQLDLENHLSSIFQYKFETLINTHSYIQEIWKMTVDYVDTAITVINEVKNQSASNGINSLRMITTIGVLSGIFTYLSKDTFPIFTWIGVWYFVILILGTWLIDKIVSYVYQQLQYRLKFTRHLGIKS